jgi:hypothetical protein
MLLSPIDLYPGHGGLVYLSVVLNTISNWLPEHSSHDRELSILFSFKEPIAIADIMMQEGEQ